MQLLAGTSGFSYKEWVGEFYPDKLPAKGMLAHYATRLPIVEINNTFYRMPNAAASPSVALPKCLIRFVLPSRCRGASRTSNGCATAARSCGSCCARSRILRPASARCSCSSRRTRVATRRRSRASSATFPRGLRVAFEFRNESWLVPAVFALLESRNAALVQSESDETFEPLPWTADWAYLRLRRVEYTTDDLAALARADRRVRSGGSAGLLQARGRRNRPQARGAAARHGGAALAALRPETGRNPRRR